MHTDLDMPGYEEGWPEWTDMVRWYPSAVHRRRWLMKTLVEIGPRSVLDVGCGPGYLLEAFHAVLPGARFVGVDQAESVLVEDRKRMPWCEMRPLDVGREKLDERFDAVVCTEVLEHVEDDESALANLAAMTGGHLLLTVPSGPIFPLERGFGHIRHYEKDALCARVSRHGLRIVSARAWGFPVMSAFKRAANLRPQATLSTFGHGRWSLPARAVGAALTGLFYLNVPGHGPQLLIHAAR